MFKGFLANPRVNILIWLQTDWIFLANPRGNILIWLQTHWICGTGSLHLFIGSWEKQSDWFDRVLATLRVQVHLDKTNFIINLLLRTVEKI